MIFATEQSLSLICHIFFFHIEGSLSNKKEISWEIISVIICTEEMIYFFSKYMLFIVRKVQTCNAVSDFELEWVNILNVQACFLNTKSIDCMLLSAFWNNKIYIGPYPWK